MQNIKIDTGLTPLYKLERMQMTQVNKSNDSIMKDEVIIESDGAGVEDSGVFFPDEGEGGDKEGTAEDFWEDKKVVFIFLPEKKFERDFSVVYFLFYAGFADYFQVLLIYEEEFFEEIRVWNCEVVERLFQPLKNGQVVVFYAFAAAVVEIFAEFYFFAAFVI
ncbi:hypothetical protein PPERSA_08278 [Pseudocohnilembus persalinus]|uniref:Uncharacterized protein n=1 Tax=Pseudocohnilembus persalinus TaxID=266149 RepID=A0A0V0Q797_PSEPJ|nr:hypothetical protein PPERSA_08278 [Pseudocohnilembus persalinus]|eukprot:KRW98115.1 hypothetical protein PPERSA_08278 [Pseudocohnilembus persalinus]